MTAVKPGHHIPGKSEMSRFHPAEKSGLARGNDRNGHDPASPLTEPSSPLIRNGIGSKTFAAGGRSIQSLSRRRALPFSSFSVSSGPSGSVFSHSVPGGFSANG